MSALKKGPKGFQLAKDQAGLLAQQQRIQNRMTKLGDAAPGKYAKRLGKVQTALTQFPAQTTPGTEAPAGPTAPTIEDINKGGNQIINDQFGLIHDVQQNNPLAQDYNTMRGQATDYAMNEFNRQMQPQWKQQDEDFQQQMAQRGIAYGSDTYNKAYQQQIADPRANAQQGAFNNAFQLGQGEQAQMFGQGAQKAMLPFQQLSYTSPFYQGQMQNQLQQGQQQFLGSQNQMDRDQALKLQQLQGKQQLEAIRATPRGGGGGGGDLTYEQRLGLLDREFFNKQVLNAQNGGDPQGGGYGNGFASGIGAGTGAVLGSVFR